MPYIKIINDKKFVAADWTKSRIMAENLAKGIAAETNRETKIFQERNPFRSADNYNKMGFLIYKEVRGSDLY